MLLVALNRLGLISAIAARLARPFVVNENGTNRILTEAGDTIVME